MAQERAYISHFTPEDIAGIIDGEIIREEAGIRIVNKALEFDLVVGIDGSLQRLEYLTVDRRLKTVNLQGRANFKAGDEIHSVPPQKIRPDVPLDSQDFWVYQVSKHGVKRGMIYRRQSPKV